MTATLHQSADAALRTGRVTDAMALLGELVAANPDDYDAWMKLAALRRSTADLVGALDAANAALGVRPNTFLALLLKGNLHERMGDHGRAAEVYRAVLFHAPTDAQLPSKIVSQLEHIRGYLKKRRAAIENAMPKLAALDAQSGARARRFLDNALDRRPVFHQEPTHYRYPGLADIEFFDTAHGELLDRLRRDWRIIRQEYEALAALHAERARPYVDFAPGQPVGQWQALNRSPQWNAFHLLRFGEPDPVNAALCPQTLAALAGPSQVDAPYLTPNVLFSLLAPHTHIPPHHGVANFRVLVHLPLIVPPECRFRVGGETRNWIEGEPWIFDDTIEHEAWNNSDELRVILIADLWRPELDEIDRQIIRDFFAAQTTDQALGAL